MGTVIQLNVAAASMGIFRPSTMPATLETFDPVACPYCGAITPPADVQQDWTVIYRCVCRMVFSSSKDGILRRGISGVPFR